jgi:hypothetical protein
MNRSSEATLIVRAASLSPIRRLGSFSIRARSTSSSASRRRFTSRASTSPLSYAGSSSIAATSPRKLSASHARWNVPLPPGELQFDILASASNSNDAAIRTRQDAVSLAGVLSYLANGPVGVPRLVLLHEVGHDDDTREYHFFLPDTLNLRSTTRLGTTAISDLLARLHNLDPNARPRVERAMHWRAVALSLDDSLERLQAILTAFEALNPLLADYLGVDRHETRTCKSCGAESQVSVATGVYAWLKRECGESIARETREVRNGLIHGFRSIDELYTAATAIAEPAERALMKAIAAVADADEIEDLIDWPPLAPTIPFALAMHGTCTGPVEAAYFQDGSLPEFEPKMRIKSSHLVEGEDRATIELEQNARIRAAAGVSIQILGTTMPLDAGARLEGPPALVITPAAKTSTE